MPTLTIKKIRGRTASDLERLLPQRALGPTYGSIAARVFLTTPSGSQETEAALETAIVEQLGFSSHVVDLITQPVLYYRHDGRVRHHTPDVLVEIANYVLGHPRYYLIEAKPLKFTPRFREDSNVKIEVARLWCQSAGAQYRILSETEIRTPYLANVRALTQARRKPLDPEILRMLLSACSKQPTVRTALDDLEAAGVARHLARSAIERAVAQHEVFCDLRMPFTDDSRLGRPSLTAHERGENDPFLTILRGADEGL